MSQLRLLYVHNDYARFSGEEQAIEGIAGLMEDRGHQIEWMRKSSVGIRESFPAKAHALASGIWSPASAREIEGRIRERRPDLVHVQNLYPLISSSILHVCKRLGLPVIMRCPNYRLFCPTGLHLRGGRVCESCLGRGRELNCVRFNCEGDKAKSLGYAVRNAFNRLTSSIVSNVDRFVVLTQFQRGMFIRNGISPDRIEVIPNVSPATLALPEAGDGDGPIIFVGRLDPSKGIEEFLSAANCLPHLQFAVAGDLTDAPNYVRDAPANVEFMGLLDTEGLGRLYRRASIVVCPSKWYEGFPNVIVQAMAYGKPVIGTRIGAIPEIVIDGRTGLLVAPGSVAELTSAIMRLWSNGLLRTSLGAEGYQLAQTGYSPKTVADLWEAIYEGVVSSTRRG